MISTVLVSYHRASSSIVQLVICPDGLYMRAIFKHAV